jgi:hypothetical protein
LECWNTGKVEKWRISLRCVSVPSFQYSNSPLVDAFVASIETRKLFVDRPRPEAPAGDARRALGGVAAASRRMLTIAAIRPLRATSRDVVRHLFSDERICPVYRLCSRQMSVCAFLAAFDASTEWAQSWVIGCSLTERLGAYAEWYAFFPQSADTEKSEHYVNGGFGLLITDDIQWDIRAGVGLNDVADDYFVGTGLSARFR